MLAVLDFMRCSVGSNGAVGEKYVNWAEKK